MLSSLRRFTIHALKASRGVSSSQNRGVMEMLAAFNRFEEEAKKGTLAANPPNTQRKWEDLSAFEERARAADVEDSLTYLTFARKLLWETPGQVGPTRAWSWYKAEAKRRADLAGAPPPTFDEKVDFNAFTADLKKAALEVQRERRLKRYIKKKRKWKPMVENPGYEEPEDTYETEDWRFSDLARRQSLAEDRWKAEYYTAVVEAIDKAMDSSEAPHDSDRMVDVMKNAIKMHLKEKARPTLTNELSDFVTPYMMKRTVLERSLHENCVRNQVDESMVETFLDRRPDLVKLRQKADLPPEVTEPLMAFRGVTTWSHDSRARLQQKVERLGTLLDAIQKEEQFVSAHGSSTPEDWPFDHPYANHFGFTSEAPHRGEKTGGMFFGRPLSELHKQEKKLRYPTLQRVAHSLPSDPTYRNSVTHAIKVLELNKGWDFESKTRAINSLKEVFDSLPSHENFRQKMEKVLPMNRFNKDDRKKLAPGVRFQRSYFKRWQMLRRKVDYSNSITHAKPCWLRYQERLAKKKKK